MNKQIEVKAVYNRLDEIVFYADEYGNTYDTEEVRQDRLEAMAKAMAEDEREPEYEHDADDYATYIIDEFDSIDYDEWDALTGCSYEQHILAEIDYRLGK